MRGAVRETLPCALRPALRSESGVVAGRGRRVRRGPPRRVRRSGLSSHEEALPPLDRLRSSRREIAVDLAGVGLGGGGFPEPRVARDLTPGARAGLGVRSAATVRLRLLLFQELLQTSRARPGRVPPGRTWCQPSAARRGGPSMAAPPQARRESGSIGQIEGSVSCRWDFHAVAKFATAAWSRLLTVPSGISSESAIWL